MPSFWTLAGQFVVTLHWCLYSYACFGWIGFHTVSCGSYLFFSLIYIVSGVLSAEIIHIIMSIPHIMHISFCPSYDQTTVH